MATVHVRYIKMFRNSSPTILKKNFLKMFKNTISLSKIEFRTLCPARAPRGFCQGGSLSEITCICLDNISTKFHSIITHAQQFAKFLKIHKKLGMFDKTG